MSNDIVYYNDIIVLLLEEYSIDDNDNNNNGSGYVGISSSLEPLQEHNECCTQLRIIPFNDIDLNNSLPCNFYERCLFRITSANSIHNDKKYVQYGDDIRLCHEPTGCYLQSTMQQNIFDMTTESKCIYLTNDKIQINNSSTIWIISSQYKFRSTEDQVYRNDYITLKSLTSDKYINSVNISPDKYMYDHLLSLSQTIEADTVAGFQLKVVTSSRDTTAEMKDDDCIRVGDYITIWHTELKGLIISRVDDENDLMSSFSPLGRICRTLTRPKHRTHGLYIRTCDKFSKLYDSVFQILPQGNNETYGSPLHDGESIFLRHLNSGLFMAFRPPNLGDALVLFNESCTRLNDSNELICDETLCVGMTEEMETSALFSIHSLDSSNDAKILFYSENLYCQHKNTSMTFAFSNKNDNPRWCEYKNDYPLKPAFHTRARGNIWQFQRVQKKFLEELIFIIKMLPSCRAAIVCTQINNSLTSNAPILRQFHLTLRSLLNYITGKLDSKPSLIEPILEEEQPIFCESAEEKTEYTFFNADGKPIVEPTVLEEICDDDVQFEADYLPSIAYWLGRDVNNSLKSQYQFRDNETDFLKEESIQYRQQLISESRLLDHCIHFVNICFILSRSNEYESDNYPIELMSCCKLITKLLTFCCFKNSAVSRKVASIHGTLMSFVMQHISGWLSPIEAILEELDDSNNAQLLTDNNLIHIIEQMHQLRIQGKVDEAILVIQLLSTLFAAGVINPTNDIIADSILPPYVNDTSNETEFESVLFKMRKSINGEWQISFDVDMQTFANYTETDITILEEIRSFREFFRKYNTTKEQLIDQEVVADENLDFYECLNMLEDLGFAGQLLRDELNNLEESTEVQFLFWWLSRKTFLVTSSFSSLHRIGHDKILDLFRLLDDDDKNGMLSPYSQRTEKWSVQGLWEQEKYEPNANESELQKNSPFFWDKIIQLRIPLFSSPTFLDSSKVNRPSVGFISNNIGFIMLTGWTDLFDLFRVACTEREWTRSSFKLLGNICRGDYGNQLIVSRILSAELLLDMLHQDISIIDKALIYSLLYEIYVSHDFVFATSVILDLSPESSSKVWIGLGESEMISSTTCSEVFNLYSRHSSCYCRDGSVLRAELLACIKTDIDLINLSCTNADVVFFAIAFQKLLVELLKRGFTFISLEERAPKYANVSNNVECLNISSCCYSIFDIEINRPKTEFSSNEIMLILRDKLQWHHDLEILKDVLASDDSDAIMNFQLKCKKLYNDPFVIESKTVAISILEHESKTRQLGNILNIAQDIEGILKSTKISSSFQDEIEHKIANCSSIKKTISAIFSSAGENKINLLLHTTLHNHNDLQDSLYKFIYNDMNPCMYLLDILPKVIFTPSFQASFISRLAERFYLLIKCYVTMLQTNGYKLQIVNAITYLLECTQCLATIHHDDICRNETQNAKDTKYTFFSFMKQNNDKKSSTAFEIEIALDSETDIFNMNSNNNHNSLPAECIDGLFSLTKSLIIPQQAWDKYDIMLQDLIDKLCSCIASVIRGSFELCMTCLHDFYTFVLENWTNGHGVARLAQILFESCVIVEDSDLKGFKLDMIGSFLSPENVSDQIYIFRSIVANHYNPTLQKYFMLAFLEREFYTMIPISMGIRNEVTPSQLCLINILIRVLKAGHCDGSTLSTIRDIFSEDICESCLCQSKSLIFRGYILQLSCLIHDYLPLVSFVLSDMISIEMQCTSRDYFNRHQYELKEYINSIIALLQFSLETYIDGDKFLLTKTNKLIKKYLKESMMADDFFYFELPDAESQQPLTKLPSLYCQCLLSFLDLLLANNSIIFTSYNDIDFDTDIIKITSLTLIILESSFDENIDLRRQLKKKIKTIVDHTIQLYKTNTITLKIEQMCHHDIKNIIIKLLLLEHEKRLMQKESEIGCLKTVSHDISDANIRDHPVIRILNHYLKLSQCYLSDQDTCPSDGSDISYKKELAVDFLLKLKKGDNSSCWIILGSMIIRNMILYLCKKPNSDEQHHVAFLRTLIIMLDNNIDDINDNVHDSKKQSLLLFHEIQELKQTQLALSALGVLPLIHEIICSSNIPTVSSLLALILCTKIIRGNDKTKNILMQTIVNIDNKNSHLRKGFCTIIHQMLKHCGLQLSRILWSQSSSSSSVDVLKSLSQIMKFIGIFCEGQNASVQLFIREQRQCKVSVDLVSKVGTVIESILMTIESNINYLSNPAFTTSLAPLIPMNNKSQRRNMIAWHIGDLNYEMIAKLLITAQTCFSTVKELCQVCNDNQNLIIKRITRWPILLEYLGSMQLNETTVINNGYYNSRITWKAFNAVDFYSIYLREIGRVNSLHHDDIHRINALASNKYELQLIAGLIEIGQTTELALLKMILSLIETGSISRINDVFSNVNEPVILQNMNTYYKLSFQRNMQRLTRYRYERSSELAVLYYSTLSAIASAELIDGHSSTMHMIEEWEKSHALTSFVASVEIIDSCDRLCTIFFDIPSLVSNYWSYPETQKIRSDIKWTITRTSPEEKLYSFYECMNEVIHVMKRQKRLSKVLSPLVHSIFGGKSFINCRIIPKQRLLFLIITILLNMYYAYLSFSDNHPNDQYTSSVMYWSQYVILLSALHSCVGGLLLIRHILNSRAADHLIHTGKFLSVIGYITTIPKVIFYVATDAWWPFLLVGCSIVALIKSYYALYAICLLDAIPQLRFMNFLIIAIKKNLTKVIFTILLAIILLYLIAVMTYLFFSNQYGFQGHYGCDSFLNCFKLHIDYGLQNYPDWNDNGTIQPNIRGINDNTLVGRLSSNILGTVYNLFYVILFNLVLQAILAGLIIDAFTRMREENDSIENDIRSQCFICSIQREEFGHNGISYDHHIKQEHNMWKYVWFSIYIDEKDPNTMSGTEHYAYQMMQDKQSFVKLIPIKRSLSLERKK